MVGFIPQHLKYDAVLQLLRPLGGSRGLLSCSQSHLCWWQLYCTMLRESQRTGSVTMVSSNNSEQTKGWRGWQNAQRPLIYADTHQGKDSLSFRLFLLVFTSSSLFSLTLLLCPHCAHLVTVQYNGKASHFNDLIKEVYTENEKGRFFHFIFSSHLGIHYGVFRGSCLPISITSKIIIKCWLPAGQKPLDKWLFSPKLTLKNISGYRVQH